MTKDEVETPELELPDESDGNDNPDHLEIAGDVDEAPVETVQDSDKDKSRLEKRLKDTQAAFTKAKQTESELKSKLDMLTGQVQTLLQLQSSKQETKEESPFDFLDKDDEVNSLLDDPKNVAGALKRALGGISQVLEKRDAFILEQIKQEFNRRGSVTNEIQAKIDELEKDDDYKGFSREQLAVIAKKAVVRKSDGDNYAGSPGGARRAPQRQEKSDVEKKADEIFKQLYGED